ncbi:MAG: RdgB/HAM1 family non-canonical purine NTP pyrophosphatase [Anaerolineales bacterium]|nr:RdgB/HAM1 family non-canonical purine NTP pyrophosphatase [Anaerolineales bacterium]
MIKLLLASSKLGKLREIQALLDYLDVILQTPEQLDLTIDVDEDGVTYAENAALKASAFAQASGLLTLADDSGLEVDVLGGLPGIHSARFSQLPHATDADRRNYLLDRLSGSPRPWSAQFHCTVALTTPGGDICFANGECHGEIIPEERGQGGFGYDPIFLLSDLGRTMAELDMEEKNRLSHRARAVKASLPILTKLIRECE